MKREWVFAIAAAAALTLKPTPAGAQSNSLFHAQPRPAAASQPAAPQAKSATGSAAATAQPSLQNERQFAQPNSVLLRVSPFAVAPPQPEKIGVNSWVTVIVLESKTATSDSKLESKKDWTLDSELKKWLKYSDKNGVQPATLSAGNPAVSFDWQNDYKGDGKYDRKDSLTTRLEAKVIDVKPNGSLVLEARKAIKIDDEGYTMTLTGECRSQDVTAQNTVLSTQIGDVQMNIQHEGAVRDAARRGWLMRGLDVLRPF